MLEQLKTLNKNQKIGAAVVAVLFVLVVGLVVYLKSIDFNEYKPQIQQAVQEATGRTLNIDGQLQLSISLHPALLLEGIHLDNAPDGSRATMVDVERIEVELRLLPLLFGNLHVENLVLIRPDILLETLADGTGNWVMAPEGLVAEAAAEQDTEVSSSGSAVVLPQVHRMTIKEAKLSYRDAKSGETQSLSLPGVELWEDDDSDETLNLLVEGQFNNIPLKVEGKLTTLSALADNEQIEINLLTAVAGSEVQISGSVAKPMDGKGLALVLDLSAPDLATVGALAGVALAHSALDLKVALKDSDAGFDLSDLQASLGGSDVTGNIRMALGQAIPSINIALQSEKFSLTDVFAEQKADAAKGSAVKDAKAQKAGGKKQDKRVFPADPIDVKALKSVDVDITYKAKRFFLPGMALADMDLQAQLKNGVLKLSPFKAQLGGGTVNMTMALHGNRLPASFNLVVRGRKINSGRVLAEGGGTKEAPMMQGGSLNADVSLKGRGRSIAEIMGHSQGRIKIRLGKAKVKSDALNMVGGDVVMTLVDKLNPFAESKDYMDLQCGVVHFRVNDGLMVSEDGIAIETDRMNILSEGEINLQKETIDLSIGTEPRDGIGANLSNMVNVVKLGGTLAEPGVAMDVGKSGMAAARVAGALATGGLSLLGEGLFDRATADSSPCKTALDMK